MAIFSGPKGAAGVMGALLMAALPWQVRAGDSPGDLEPEPKYRPAWSLRDAGGAEWTARLQQAAREGRVADFEVAVDCVLDLYHGDPAPVLESLLPLLQAEQVAIRVKVAAAFLKSGLHRDEAVKALRAIEGRKGYTTAEFDGIGDDPREVVAGILADYGVKEAADEIWAYFQDQGGSRAPEYLARLGDPRAVEGVKSSLEKGAVLVVSSGGILARFQVKEAAAPLRALAERSIPGDGDPQMDLENCELALAVYQLTGERKYLEYLLDHGRDPDAQEMLDKIRTPEVDAYFERCTHSPQRMIAERALITLQLRRPGSAVVRGIVSDYLTLKNPRPCIASNTILMVGAHLHDPEIDALGKVFDASEGKQRWQRAWFRRDWPLFNVMERF